MVKIIKSLADAKRLIHEGYTFHDMKNEWFEDVSFLLDEIHQRDERIKLLEKVIVEDRIACRPKAIEATE
jgi:hypothetical protein